MTLKERIETLSVVGSEMSEVCQTPELYNFPGFERIYNSNPWFSEEFVRFALTECSKNLKTDILNKWSDKYNIPDGLSDRTLGLIMAGNIPMVGLHDLICGFICGVNLNIKLSSKDSLLLKWIIDRILIKSPGYASKIKISESRVDNFDAIIATGSNNTNRYFEYYFSSYPNILRKNRNSVAILSGKETKEELEALADDIFVYFGLGCRNVSKIYVPENYDFNPLCNAFQKYIHLKDHFKFANNLDYQYAVLAMNKILHVNPGNLFLVEKSDIAAPVGVVNYEYYNDLDVVEQILTENSEKIQCIITKCTGFSDKLAFGKSQKPGLNEYADNADTISFILNLRK